MVTESERQRQQRRAAEFKARKKLEGRFGGVTGRESPAVAAAISRMRKEATALAESEGISIAEAERRIVRLEAARSEAKVLASRLKKRRASPEDIARFERKYGVGSFERLVEKIPTVVPREPPIKLTKEQEARLGAILGLRGEALKEFMRKATPEERAELLAGLPPAVAVGIKGRVAIRGEVPLLFEPKEPIPKVDVRERLFPTEEEARISEVLAPPEVLKPPKLPPEQLAKLREIRERGRKAEIAFEKLTEFFERPGTIQEMLGRPTPLDISELPFLKESKFGESLRETKKAFWFGPLRLPVAMAELGAVVGETIATADLLSTSPEGRRILGTSAKSATITTIAEAPRVLKETFISPEAIGTAPWLLIGARGVRRGRVPKEELSTLSKQMSGTKRGKQIIGIEEPIAPKKPTIPPPSIKFEPIHGIKKAKRVVLEPPKIRGVPTEAPAFELIRPKPPRRKIKEIVPPEVGITKQQRLALKRFKERKVGEPSKAGQKAFGEFFRIIETGIRKPTKVEARFLLGQVEALARRRPELLISKKQRLALKRFKEKEILRRRRERPFEEIERISERLFKPTKPKPKEKLPLALRRFKEKQIKEPSKTGQQAFGKFFRVVETGRPALTKQQLAFIRGQVKAKIKRKPELLISKQQRLALRRARERGLVGKRRPFEEIEKITKERFKPKKPKEKLPLALRRFKEKQIKEPSKAGQKAFGEFQRIVETGLPKPTPTELAFLKGQLKRRLEKKLFKPTKIQIKALKRFTAKEARERLKKVKAFKGLTEAELRRIKIRKIKKPRVPKKIIIPKFKEPKIPKEFKAKPTRQGQLLITRQVPKKKVLVKAKRAIKKKKPKIRPRIIPRVVEKPSKFVGRGIYEVQEFEVARIPGISKTAFAKEQFKPRPQLQRQMFKPKVRPRAITAVARIEKIAERRIRIPGLVPKEKIREEVVGKPKLKEKEKLVGRMKERFREKEYFRFGEIFKPAFAFRERFREKRRLIDRFQMTQFRKKKPRLIIKRRKIKKPFEERKKKIPSRELIYKPSLAAVIYKIKARPKEAKRLLTKKVEPIGIRPLTTSDPVSKRVLGINGKKGGGLF